MKKTLFILSALLAIFILKGIIVAQIEGEPYIRFDQEWWTFGEIMEGDEVSHVFNVENVGRANLVIHNVNVGCGCTLASISSEVIEPGKSAGVQVTFNSKGFPGKVSKFVYVESNDPKTPRKTLLISGYVRPSSRMVNISVEPREWKLLLSRNKKTRGEFIVRNEGQRELMIKIINNPSLPYEVFIPPLEAKVSKLRPIPYKVSSNSFSPYEASIPPFGYITPFIRLREEKTKPVSEGYIYLEIAIPFTNY